MRSVKTAMLFLLMVTAAAFLCACGQKASPDEPYKKLMTAFEDAGYVCVLEEAPEGAMVGIYNATVWKTLKAGEESVLVYFDESNRADYLLTMIDQSVYGYATNFGQRFILNYSGADEALLEFLKTL